MHLFCVQTSASSNIELPNILIMGTPGTGKTALAQALVEQLNKAGLKYQHVEVSLARALRAQRSAADRTDCR